MKVSYLLIAHYFHLTKCSNYMSPEKAGFIIGRDVETELDDDIEIQREQLSFSDDNSVGTVPLKSSSKVRDQRETKVGKAGKSVKSKDPNNQKISKTRPRRPQLIPPLYFQPKPEHTFMKVMLERHRHEISMRPTNEKIEVQVLVKIESISEISEVNMDLTVTMTIRQIWQDYRVVLDRCA